MLGETRGKSRELFAAAAKRMPVTDTVVGAARRGLTWKENNPALQFQIANEKCRVTPWEEPISMEQRQSLAQIEAWETQCQLSTPGLETVTAPEPDGRASCSGFSPKPAAAHLVRMFDNTVRGTCLGGRLKGGGESLGQHPYQGRRRRPCHLMRPPDWWENISNSHHAPDGRNWVMRGD
jgi:hypothetical protein